MARVRMGPGGGWEFVARRDNRLSLVVTADEAVRVAGLLLTLAARHPAGLVVLDLPKEEGLADVHS